MITETSEKFARPLIYIIAGEVSGDIIGAKLIREIKRLQKNKFSFAGVGGEQMTNEGVQSLFPISEMAVMGIFELVPHVPNLIRRINETVQDIMAKKPVAVISIDSKAFTMRVAKLIQKKQKENDKEIKLIHMVAPTVWAWRPGRAKNISKFLDHLLTLFPFEPPFFTRHGLPTTFIGHPLAEQKVGCSSVYRNTHDVDEATKIISLLPGSRPGEIKRLLPTFKKTMDLLLKKYPNIHITMPTVVSVEEMLRRETLGWRTPVSIITDPEMKLNALAASSVALAASGTVTLELALAKVPSVIAYKVNPLSAIIGYFLVNQDAVVLPNKLMGKEIFPLYLQWKCTPCNLYKAVFQKIENPTDQLIEVSDAIRNMLRPNKQSSQSLAAQIIIKVVEDAKTLSL
jgi:lipid-A-disaccharide synthase